MKEQIKKSAFICKKADFIFIPKVG